eukprot:IDg2834t1
MPAKLGDRTELRHRDWRISLSSPSPSRARGEPTPLQNSSTSCACRCGTSRFEAAGGAAPHQHMLLLDSFPSQVLVDLNHRAALQQRAVRLRLAGGREPERVLTMGAVDCVEFVQRLLHGVDTGGVAEGVDERNDRLERPVLVKFQLIAHVAEAAVDRERVWPLSMKLSTTRSWRPSATRALMYATIALFLFCPVHRHVLRRKTTNAVMKIDARRAHALLNGIRENESAVLLPVTLKGRQKHERTRPVRSRLADGGCNVMQKILDFMYLLLVKTTVARYPS